MSRSIVFCLGMILMVVSCYVDPLPDPKCFNLDTLPIPQEVADTQDPSLIFQFLSKQPDHCVNTSDQNTGLQRCRSFYLDKLGYSNSADFAGLKLIRFISINDQYGRCEILCEESSCECLFDSDCNGVESSQCLWFGLSLDSENSCDEEFGCTFCR